MHWATCSRRSRLQEAGQGLQKDPGRAPGPCWRQQPSLALDTAGPGSPSCKQTTRPHPAPPAASSPAVAGVPPSTVTAPGHWAPMLPLPRSLHRPGSVKPHPTDSSSVFWPPAGAVPGPLALSAEQRTRVPGLQSHELGPVPTELSRSPKGGTDLWSESRVGACLGGGHRQSRAQPHPGTWDPRSWGGGGREGEAGALLGTPPELLPCPPTPGAVQSELRYGGRRAQRRPLSPVSPAPRARRPG